MGLQKINSAHVYTKLEEATARIPVNMCKARGFLASVYFSVLLGLVITQGGIVLEEASLFLKEYDAAAQEAKFKGVSVSWNYYVNMTEENKQLLSAQKVKDAEFDKEAAFNASRFNWKGFQESHPDIYRQFRFIANQGIGALNDTTKIARFGDLRILMRGIYSNGKVNLNGKNLTLYPGITRLLKESRNYSERLEVWKQWRSNVGRSIGKHYTEFIHLQNEAARANGWSDTGAYWRSWYESDTFREEVRRLWAETKPLYRQLHAYVRRFLRRQYGAEQFPADGHVPAHLTGRMRDLYKDVRPFKNKRNIDVTEEMKAQGYDAKRMFRVADDFFTSLGLQRVPDAFWRDSLLSKPPDRLVQCHPSAWDFNNGEDFRVRMCTDVTMSDLITAHHEMGHIQYYMQYRHLPLVYRKGANPGFHEAVGDLLALSVSRPDYLQHIGLLKTAENDTEADLNFLMKEALETIAFLPFGYLVDTWRWGVFNGSTQPSEYNQHWWKLRCKHQGIFPPIARSADDFDPGAVFHIAADVPYVRYIVSFFLRFQFHKALCETAGQGGRPLHTCNIHGSKTAGAHLANMLKLGGSKPWPQALEELTGSTKMDASPLLEYYQPLHDWLKTENAKYPEDKIGWDEDKCPEVIPSPTCTSAVNYLNEVFMYLVVFYAIGQMLL